jgi:hypothetical protein
MPRGEVGTRARSRTASGARRGEQRRDWRSPAVRLASSTAFSSPRARPRPLLRARPWPFAISFGLALAWLLVNVRRVSPLDVLPLIWTWLTLWIVISLLLELWKRFLDATNVSGR